MSSAQRSFRCFRCPLRSIVRPPSRHFYASASLNSELTRPSVAPKLKVDIKHIRQNPALYEHNCLERNYKAHASYPARIISKHEEWYNFQLEGQGVRGRNNRVKLQLADPTIQDEERTQLIDEARRLKEKISIIGSKESALISEIESLAAALCNLTSAETPRDNKPKTTSYINEPPHERVWRSHVHIGSELNLLNFSKAATTSGWGWYFLLNEAVTLEHALVQYAFSVVEKRGWGKISPPSMGYSHIAAGCGFQPRDQNGESQIYNIQQNPGDVGRKPGLSLAGTAEIPLAGMEANQTLEEADLPIKRVGASRCFRAEAGARGVDTKGLYRVHEFTKVEMFAWSLPSISASNEIFEEMLSIQIEILQSLGLYCRILEMPSTDLGASAFRKRDIEVLFPTRRPKDDGWGEVTSTSICTDYQTRRLATRVNMKSLGGKIAFPYTVNGTAMAVPRVLAAILEYGWDEQRKEVKIPKALWPWMNGVRVIARREKLR
jgi:seryl-tRNA synthetase